MNILGDLLGLLVEPVVDSLEEEKSKYVVLVV